MTSDKEVHLFQRTGGANSGKFTGISYAHGRYWAVTENLGLWTAETSDFS